MGTFSVPKSIGDPQGENWIDLDALVDTGASIVSMPASMLIDLGVKPAAQHRFQFAKGRTRTLDIGEARLRIDGMEVGTLVAFNDEGTPVLLGALALEALFLGVDPVAQRLVPVDGLMMPLED